MKKYRNPKTLILAFLLISGAILSSCVEKISKSEISTANKLETKIDYSGLLALLNEQSSNVLLLDVRTPEEYSQGFIPNAILVPYDLLEKSFTEPDKTRPIIVYCRTGRRSAIAQQSLRNMGYTNVFDFGAISNWKGNLKF